MQRDDKLFHHETMATTRRLIEQTGDVDPSVALAAALRHACLLAIQQETRCGLFEVAVRETYRDLVHELLQRAKEPAAETHPAAVVLPFVRRAV
jgi:hypothetical protein